MDKSNLNHTHSYLSCERLNLNFKHYIVEKKQCVLFRLKYFNLAFQRIHKVVRYFRLIHHLRLSWNSFEQPAPSWFFRLFKNYFCIVNIYCYLLQACRCMKYFTRLFTFERRRFIISVTLCPMKSTIKFGAGYTNNYDIRENV